MEFLFNLFFGLLMICIIACVLGMLHLTITCFLEIIKDMNFFVIDNENKENKNIYKKDFKSSTINNELEVLLKNHLNGEFKNKKDKKRFKKLYKNILKLIK